MEDMTQTLKNFIRKGGIVLLMQLLIYAPFLSGRLVNPDCFWIGMVYKPSYKWEVSLGRYLLGVDQALLGYSMNPTFMTIASMLISSMAISLLLEPFREICGWRRGLCAALLAMSPFLWCTYTYYFCSAFYMKAYLLAAAAFVLITKGGSEGNISADVLRRVLLAGLCLCLSLATYQAYISVYLTFALLYPAYICLVRKRAELRQVFRLILRFLAAFLCGIALYLLSTKLVQEGLHITPDSSRGFDRMGKLQTGDLLHQIYLTYAYEFHYFFRDSFLNNSYGVLISRRSVNLIFFLIIGLTFLLTLYRIRCSVLRKAMCVLFLFLLPIAQMVITLAAPGASVLDTTGSIMLVCMNAAYAGPLLVIFGAEAVRARDAISVNISADAGITVSDSKNLDTKALCGPESNNRNRTGAGAGTRSVVSFLRSIHTFALIPASALVIWMLGCLALDAEQFLGYERSKTDHVLEEISSRVDVLAKCDLSEQKVCIIGDHEDGNYPNAFPELRESVQWTTAMYGNFWEGYTSHFHGMSGYFRDYFGVDYKLVETEQALKIREMQEYKAIPLFPAEKSVQKIGDVIVVKLSDE